MACHRDHRIRGRLRPDRQRSHQQDPCGAVRRGDRRSPSGSSTPTTSFYSHETGIDWDVIFLLLGMMIIVGVLRQTGVFEYIAIWAAKRANGSPLRIMILLVLVTAFASALLDNVTTVLLIAPVTLLVCDRLAINPVPFLIAEVLASNIGGASTLVGDPPNIIIASRAGLTFNDFLVHMLPIVVIVLVVFIALIPFSSAARSTSIPHEWPT